MNEPSAILSHVSVGTVDLDRAVSFYGPVLRTLGIGIVERIDDVAVGFGRDYPEFWVVLPENGEPASVGNGTHTGFLADSREAVEDFHAAAMASGGLDEGKPGARPHYGEPYYGCFIRDPDGHKIEAMFWDVPA